MIWPVAIVVLSTVLYHVAQKSIPAGAPPVASLAVSYGVALLGTFALLPFFPLRMPAARSLRELNWASAAIGVSIVGVELGFLLAYRAGWRVSVGAAVANAAVAAMLVPIGLLVFHERLSGVNALGLVLCVAGLFLAVAR
jgi:multidrug transporter EmrE-like cation transporter